MIKEIYMNTFFIQDVAVDGWALTMLKPKNVGYASTCNSVGQVIILIWCICNTMENYHKFNINYHLIQMQIWYQTCGWCLGYILFTTLESAGYISFSQVLSSNHHHIWYSLPAWCQLPISWSQSFPLITKISSKALFPATPPFWFLSFSSFSSGASSSLSLPRW